MGRKGSKRSDAPESIFIERASSEGSDNESDLSPRAKKRGWREIEAWKERKFLRESLAEIWDDDQEIDESLLSGDEAEVTFYSDSEEIEVEEDLSDFDDEDFYEDED